MNRKQIVDDLVAAEKRLMEALQKAIQSHSLALADIEDALEHVHSAKMWAKRGEKSQ